MRTDTRARLLRFAVLPAALAAVAVGCGAGTGDVAGTVTYKGRPVVHGTVTFVGADGRPVAAAIGGDGSYTLSGVAVGEAKVLVDSPRPVAEATANRWTGVADRGGRAARGGKDDPALPPDAPKADSRPKDAPNPVEREVAAKWVPLPGKFRDPTQSPLAFTVKPGANSHDVRLD